jgi:ADP-ribose pyrophosphatase YjhB (NUDIX family)
MSTERLATLRDPDVGLRERKFKKKRERHTARAVILRSYDEVGLLYSRADRQFKLPGGGIKAGETPEEAAMRESFEEMGTEIAILGLIGTVVEKRARDGLYQTSTAFIAYQTGQITEPQLSKAEQKAGMERLWVPRSAAINLVGGSRGFQPKRDVLFLQHAFNKADSELPELVDI